MAIKMVGTTFDTATTALAVICLTDAENEIRKQLAKRYNFSAAPFILSATIPPMVTTLAENLAVGYMYENMSRGSKEGYARADRYIKKVNTNLQMLSAGNAQLMDSSGSLISEIEGDWKVHATSPYAHTFNEDHPKNWAVSESKIDDIQTERDSDETI